MTGRTRSHTILRTLDSVKRRKISAFTADAGDSGHCPAAARQKLVKSPSTTISWRRKKTPSISLRDLNALEGHSRI